MRKPYPMNHFCPCGSTKKYKHCCHAKGVDYFIKPGGKIVKEQPLTTEQRQALTEKKAQFVRAFGRQPNEEDEGLMRIADGFADVSSVIEKDLLARGVDKSVLYAFQKTGMVITRENESQVSVEELNRWEEAIEEYRQLKS